MEPSQVVLVCATKYPARYFHRATLLGRSLRAFPEALRPQVFLLADNHGHAAAGLSSFYNRAIEEVKDAEIIVFLHDDIFIHDWNLAFQLDQTLQIFDLIGVVGSAGVPHGQPGWWHGVDEDGGVVRNQSLTVSGSINHFDPILVRPDYFGPAPIACDLLDGVFLATRLEKLRPAGLRFDPQFIFHCYDTDFCYSARELGWTLGTWPIPLTHASGGDFGAAWLDSARRLKEKVQLANRA